jgi:hypothetical protein
MSAAVLEKPKDKKHCAACPTTPGPTPGPTPNPTDNSRPPLPAGTKVPGVNSIGRLELEVTSGNAKGTYMWGTAFKVGEKKTKDGIFDLVATTCHILQPVIEIPHGGTTWQLKRIERERLVLDYGERTDYPEPDYPPLTKYEVYSLVAYGQKEGLDVALLSVRHSHTDILHFVPPNMASALSQPAPIAVVGYVDFLHPVDPLFDLSYGPFLAFGDGKFVSLGRFTQKIDARTSAATDAIRFDPQNYMFHDAATSTGQSGSPVFSGEELKPAQGEVLAVHVCCTAYWNNEYEEPPVDEKSIPCGRIKRGSYNKAVLFQDIWNDRELCKALNYYNEKQYKCLQ